MIIIGVIFGDVEKFNNTIWEHENSQRTISSSWGKNLFGLKNLVLSPSRRPRIPGVEPAGFAENSPKWNLGFWILWRKADKKKVSHIQSADFLWNSKHVCDEATTPYHPSMNLWCRDSRLHFRNSRSLLFPGDSSRTFSFLSGEIIKMFLKANRLGFHFNASNTPEQSIHFILQHYLCQTLVCLKELSKISINIVWSLIYCPLIIKLREFNPFFQLLIVEIMHDVSTIWHLFILRISIFLHIFWL